HLQMAVVGLAAGVLRADDPVGGISEFLLVLLVHSLGGSRPADGWTPGGNSRAPAAPASWRTVSPGCTCMDHFPYPSPYLSVRTVTPRGGPGSDANFGCSTGFGASAPGTIASGSRSTRPCPM